jgi:hypothetical protein
MKQILILSIVFFSFIKAMAQEKQNNANYIETVDFIKDSFKHLIVRQESGYLHYNTAEIKENSLIIKFGLNPISHQSRRWKAEIPLNWIKKAENVINEKNSIKLTLSVGVHLLCQTEYSYPDYQVFPEKDYYRLTYDNKDMHNRVLKAFKHLSYLNSLKVKKSKF